MKEIVQMHRLSGKCMELMTIISNLHSSAKKLADIPSQEEVDNITNLALLYQSSSEEMQSCLMTFLKEVVEEPEELEVDTNETDMGYKL